MSAPGSPVLGFSRLTPPDIDRVRRWQMQTLSESYGGQAPEEEIDYLKRRFDGALTDRRQYLRLVQNRNSTIGYVWLDTNHRPTVAILDFFVAPEWRRRGYGGEMLRRTIALARRAKADKIILAVAASNVEAIGLYKRAGFIETARKTNQQRTWFRFELALPGAGPYIRTS